MSLKILQEVLVSRADEAKAQKTLGLGILTDSVLV